jgi:short-subunit dehydrogenase
MYNSLKDKVVIITGASSGIGKETALLFALAGANVVLIARHEDKLQEVVSEIISYGGRAWGIVTDVADSTALEHMINKVIERYQQIDILVNNAGFGMLGSVEQTPLNEFRRIMETNLVGVFYLCQLVLPIMKKQGAGHIMNVASVIGRRATADSSAYCASKFGLIGFTESMQVEAIGTPVKISIINPGLTNTPFPRGMSNPANRNPGNSWSHGVSPVKVAKAILRCALHPRREVYITWYDRLLILINGLFPGLISSLLSLYRKMK